jgi:lysophospholipase L1-like esterase
MTRASAARRLATAAMYGGGGLGVLGGTLYAVMRAQASWARRIIGPADTRPPPPEPLYGASLPGEPLSVLVLGDSAAVGYGMESAEDTPPGMIGAGLSHMCGRPVRITSLARVGAQSSALDGQVSEGLTAEPDLAVIVVGTNDVTHRVRPSESVRLLDAAVRRLRAAGCEVVVGTCPDLGSIKPVPHPLRLVAREWSRRLAAAQTIAVVEAGGRSVSLATLLGPSFTAAPGELFGPDRFHPSAAGYASMVAALLPSMAAAAGVWDDDEEPQVLPGDTVLPISFAAAEAVRLPGTEVTPAEVAGRDRGPRGRWAQIRHRVRRPGVPGPAAPAAR